MEELLFVYSRGAGLNLVKDIQIIHIKVLTGDHGQKIWTEPAYTCNVKPEAYGDILLIKLKVHLAKLCFMDVVWIYFHQTGTRFKLLLFKIISS